MHFSACLAEDYKIILAKFHDDQLWIRSDRWKTASTIYLNISIFNLNRPTLLIFIHLNWGKHLSSPHALRTVMGLFYVSIWKQGRKMHQFKTVEWSKQMLFNFAPPACSYFTVRKICRQYGVVKTLQLSVKFHFSLPIYLFNIQISVYSENLVKNDSNSIFNVYMQAIYAVSGKHPEMERKYLFGARRP